MKLEDLQREVASNAEDRIRSLTDIVKASDVETLEQRKLIFDYLLARANKQSNLLREFEDVIYIVGHFADQIPEFYSLSQSFSKSHAKIIKDAFESLAPEDRSIDLRNTIAIEKDARINSSIDKTMMSFSAVYNTESFVRNFIAVFIESAIEIYDALIGLMTGDESNSTLLKGTAYYHFEIISNSLDYLRSED